MKTYFGPMGERASMFRNPIFIHKIIIHLPCSECALFRSFAVHVYVVSLVIPSSTMPGITGHPVCMTVNSAQKSTS